MELPPYRSCCWGQREPQVNPPGFDAFILDPAKINGNPEYRRAVGGAEGSSRAVKKGIPDRAKNVLFPY